MYSFSDFLNYEHILHLKAMRSIKIKKEKQKKTVQISNNNRIDQRLLSHSQMVAFKMDQGGDSEQLEGRHCPISVLPLLSLPLVEFWVSGDSCQCS